MLASTAASKASHLNQQNSFCVVAQGRESSKKWKDVLCNPEFEWLLPEQTSSEKQGSLEYLALLSDEEYTEGETDDDEDIESFLVPAYLNEDGHFKEIL